MGSDFLEVFLQSSFSVAVAAFLLFRMEERLDSLTNAVTRLGSSLETLALCLVRPAQPAGAPREAMSDDEGE
ncbi:MAG: YvrJ family protein [Synergistaceae bacterium]|jgi:hypothetical protein|nr:YvrJ family protein [Synergistaceae bacterium]